MAALDNEDNEMGFLYDLFHDRLLGDLSGWRARNNLKVGIAAQGNGYALDIEMPDFEKDEVSLRLEDGFLTVTGEKHQDNDQQDDSGRTVWHDSTINVVNRTFYVGQTLSSDDIRARFADGVLHLELPDPHDTHKPAMKRIPIYD